MLCCMWWRRQYDECLVFGLPYIIFTSRQSACITQGSLYVAWESSGKWNLVWPSLIYLSQGNTLVLIHCPLGINHYKDSDASVQRFQVMTSLRECSLDVFLHVVCSYTLSWHFNSAIDVLLVGLQKESCSSICGSIWFCDDVWPTILQNACTYPWIPQLAWWCLVHHMCSKW